MPPPPAALTRLLARAEDEATALSAALDAVREAAGSRSAVLLEPAHPAGFAPAAGRGLPALPLGSPWPLAAAERRRLRRVLTRGRPALVPDLRAQFPALAARLNAPAAVLAPVLRTGGRAALLAAGRRATAPPPDLERVAWIADLTALALDRSGRRRAAARRDAVREVTGTLARGLSAPAGWTRALAGACGRIAALFGAGSASVWLYDREARELRRATRAGVLGAPARGDRRWTALRAPGAAFARGRRELLVPLRGRRRALGVLHVERLPDVVADPGELLAAADDLGAGLSAALEGHQLLDAIVRSRRLLHDAFHALSDLVIVVDQEGRVVEANRAFVDRAGRTHAECVGRPIAEFVGPALADRARAGEAARDDATREPAALAPLDGLFVVTVAPLAAVGGGARAVIVLRDVTVETRLESERAALQARLSQSEKLAALGQFIAGVAHELNNPLQGVMGHLELLRATGNLAPQVDRDLGRIYREADRAARVVRHLLVFAGSRRPALRPLGVNRLVRRAIALRRATLEEAGITVRQSFAEGLPQVRGDTVLLQQALLNLLLNAEQALDGPGVIAVTTRRTKGGVAIVVRDGGPGIPPAVLARVFEPFFTTKEVGRGTGLGLAVTYRIVLEHGGRIEAANHPGGGARFTITLPAARAGSPRRAGA